MECRGGARRAKCRNTPRADVCSGRSFRPRCYRAGWKDLKRLDRRFGLDQAFDVRPIKDAVTIERKTSGNRIVVAEEREQSRSWQLFGTRQAAQLGAVDLTDEEKRFLLDNRPLPV